MWDLAEILSSFLESLKSEPSDRLLDSEIRVLLIPVLPIPLGPEESDRDLFLPVKPDVEIDEASDVDLFLPVIEPVTFSLNTFPSRISKFVGVLARERVMKMNSLIFLVKRKTPLK